MFGTIEQALEDLGHRRLGSQGGVLDGREFIDGTVEVGRQGGVEAFALLEQA